MRKQTKKYYHSNLVGTALLATDGSGLTKQTAVNDALLTVPPSVETTQPSTMVTTDMTASLLPSLATDPIIFSPAANTNIAIPMETGYPTVNTNPAPAGSAAAAAYTSPSTLPVPGTTAFVPSTGTGTSTAGSSKWVPWVLMSLVGIGAWFAFGKKKKRKVNGAGTDLLLLGVGGLAAYMLLKKKSGGLPQVSTQEQPSTAMNLLPAPLSTSQVAPDNPPPGL